MVPGGTRVLEVPWGNGLSRAQFETGNFSPNIFAIFEDFFEVELQKYVRVPGTITMCVTFCFKKEFSLIYKKREKIGRTYYFFGFSCL